MTPSSGSNEFDTPERSLAARIAGLIEQAFVVGIRLSFPLMLLFSSVFFTYIIGGFVVNQMGLWTPAYRFLSLTDDVYFAWLGFLTSSTICMGTGSLIGLAFLTEGEGPIHNEISILASFIGFGFGAAVIRITYPTVLATIL